jgi:hypothetical protein
VARLKEPFSWKDFVALQFAQVVNSRLHKKLDKKKGITHFGHMLC